MKILTLLLALISFVCQGQMTKKEIVFNKTWKMYVYQRAGQNDPVLISFHGKFGKYNDAATMISDIEAGLTLPFKIYAPQLPAGDNDWSKNDIAAVFKQVLADGHSAAHITGVSLGGMACFASMRFNSDTTLTSWPKIKILSLGIVCGKDSWRRYPDYAKHKIKLWHGLADPTMPYSNVNRAVVAVKALGGDITMKAYSGIGHNVWTKAYNSNEPDNYFSWLLSLPQ